MNSPWTPELDNELSGYLASSLLHQLIAVRMNRTLASINLRVSRLGLSKCKSGRPHGLSTHCKRGHPLTPDNLYIRIRGGREERQCKQCSLDADRLRYATRVQGTEGPRMEACTLQSDENT